ncbi:CvpA family protein [Paenibacillus hodogayensis]|uniref:CvpA family protein n=1 Tax=Paenibacillus hodogayensis TaxID=279208 RepID=A0ABV5VRI3_9BACL
MDHRNILDIVAAVLVVAALAIGYHRGFISQLVSLIGLVAALAAAYWFYDDVAPLVAALLPLDKFAAYDRYAPWLEGLKIDVYAYNAVAFALIFFLAKIGLSLAGRVLHLIAQAPGLKFVNKWSGALLSLVEAVVLFAIAVHVMSVIPSDPLQQTMRSSIAAGYVIEQTPQLTLRLREWWDEGHR